VSEAYLEGMKTRWALLGLLALCFVRSLPRRNENSPIVMTYIIMGFKSEAYLEGMKTGLFESESYFPTFRPKPTSKE